MWAPSSKRRTCATLAPPRGFEPRLPPPEGGALSPELRGPGGHSDRSKVSTTLAYLSHRYGGGVRKILVLVLGALLVVGCVSRPDPEPAQMRQSQPPWDAPRDAVSYIAAAGLPQLSLGDDSDPWILQIQVSVSGDPVEVPAYIGIDRLRAVQAPVHTHDPGGQVWLEGADNAASTLGHFFTLWGVRFDADCLGATCGGVTVLADGEPVDDPVALQLRGVEVVEVSVG